MLSFLDRFKIGEYSADVVLGQVEDVNSVDLLKVSVVVARVNSSMTAVVLAAGVLGASRLASAVGRSIMCWDVDCSCSGDGGERHDLHC